MKNLIITTAMFLLPFLLVGQTDIPTPQIAKNSITGSVFLSGDSGFAIDYRRRVLNNQQVVFGLQDDGFLSPELVIGYRANIKPERKLSYGVGLDFLVTKRNVIGDGVIAQTIELFPKPKYNSLRVVGGVYYELNDKVDFMAELHVCLLYTSPSPRDQRGSRMPSSA